MTESYAEHERRGFLNMFHMGTVLRRTREAYVPRFGVDVARRLWVGAALGLLGAWISVLGVVAMIVGIVSALAVGSSLPTVFGIARSLFWVIIAGSVLSILGSGIQARGMKAISTRIRAFDDSLSDDGAVRLVKYPQLYDRWLAQHPGFSVAPE